MRAYRGRHDRRTVRNLWPGSAACAAGADRGALAAFGAFFGLAAEHAVGSRAQHDAGAAAAASPTQADSDGFFSGGGDYGFQGGGSARRHRAAAPPAGQSRVS